MNESNDRMIIRNGEDSASLLFFTELNVYESEDEKALISVKYFLRLNK